MNMETAASPPGVRFQPWGAAAFAAAVESRRPILLFLVTSWSEGCREVERTCFSDLHLVALVERLTVPVRVDADERPDIADRYGLDGWPATLLLTEDGEILQGGTFLEALVLADLVERGAAAYRAREREIARRADEARQARRAGRERLLAGSSFPLMPAPRDLADEIARFLTDAADVERGGLAGAPKFLHPDALVFLFRYAARAESAGALDVARVWLDAAETSPLCMDDGRVFRCARRTDWSDPADSLSVEAYAGALRAFGAGCAALGNRYLDRLRRIAAFVRARWLPSGPSAGQPAHAILPTDLAADLAGACLLAASILDDDELGRGALALLERAALSTYVAGRGIRHLEAADAPALLSDSVTVTQTLLDAHDATGRLPYAMLAEELGHCAARAFFDPEAGAMRDRVHDGRDRGLLAEPAYPFRLNARAAGTLHRLASVSGHPAFADCAAPIVRFVASRWREEGPDAAACGNVALDLIDWRALQGGRGTRS